MKCISIVIVDDHNLIREAIANLLGLQDDFKIVGQASNGKDAINLIEKTNPDVVLMDINMPIVGGIEAIKILKSKENKSKIIVLTIYNEYEYLHKVMEMGAEGYVLKECDSETFIKAIYSVYNGQVYIDPNVTEGIDNYYKSRDNKGVRVKKVLTNREVQVLSFVKEGFVNKEIGIKLGISELTVRNHIANIFKKLKVTDRTQAVVQGFKRGFIEIE